MLGNNGFDHLQCLDRVADVDLHGITLATELADLLGNRSQLLLLSGCNHDSGAETGETKKTTMIRMILRGQGVGMGIFGEKIQVKYISDVRLITMVT